MVAFNRLAQMHFEIKAYEHATLHTLLRAAFVGDANTNTSLRKALLDEAGMTQEEDGSELDRLFDKLGPSF